MNAEKYSDEWWLQERLKQTREGLRILRMHETGIDCHYFIGSLIERISMTLGDWEEQQ